MSFVKWIAKKTGRDNGRGRGGSKKTINRPHVLSIAVHERKNKKEPYHSLAFTIGNELLKKARFVPGDMLDFDRDGDLFYLFRSNTGYKLSARGDKKSSITVVQMTIPAEISNIKPVKSMTVEHEVREKGLYFVLPEPLAEVFSDI